MFRRIVKRVFLDSSFSIFNSLMYSLIFNSLMYSLIFNSINSISRSKVGRVFLLISYSVNIIMTKSVIFALHNNKPFSYRFLIIIKIYNCGNWIIRFILKLGNVDFCFSRISEMTRFTPEDKQAVDN